MLMELTLSSSAGGKPLTHKLAKLCFLQHLHPWDTNYHRTSNQHEPSTSTHTQLLRCTAWGRGWHKKTKNILCWETSRVISVIFLPRWAWQDTMTLSQRSMHYRNSQSWWSECQTVTYFFTPHSRCTYTHTHTHKNTCLHFATAIQSKLLSEVKNIKGQSN